MPTATTSTASPTHIESLSGTGTIGGCPVKTIAPEWMVKFHTGYEIDAGDYHDVKLLCQRFGLDLPLEYEKFEADEEVA